MATCISCNGRIDGAAYDTKRKLCERLGKPYSHPKRCTECTVGALLTFAFSEDEATELHGTTPKTGGTP